MKKYEHKIVPRPGIEDTPGYVGGKDNLGLIGKVIKLSANEFKIISSFVHHNLKLLLVLWATCVVNLSASTTIGIAKIVILKNELIQVKGFERGVAIILYSISLTPLNFYLASRKINL